MTIVLKYDNLNQINIEDINIISIRWLGEKNKLNFVLFFVYGLTPKRNGKIVFSQCSKVNINIKWEKELFFEVHDIIKIDGKIPTWKIISYHPKGSISLRAMNFKMVLGGYKIKDSKLESQQTIISEDKEINVPTRSDKLIEKGPQNKNRVTKDIQKKSRLKLPRIWGDK